MSERIPQTFSEYRVQARHCARQGGYRHKHDTVLSPNRPYCWVALGKPLASLRVPVVLRLTEAKCANVRALTIVIWNLFIFHSHKLSSRWDMRFDFWSPAFPLHSIAEYGRSEPGDTNENDLGRAGMVARPESSNPKVKYWRYWVLDDSVNGLEGLGSRSPAEMTLSNISVWETMSSHYR